MAVVAPTGRDLRLVCFEGKSGLMNRIPPECFRDGSPDKAYNRSNAEIWLHNGSKIEGFTGQEPGRLRGPQFDRAWCDELAAWQYPQDTWDMLQFGLRLGEKPQAVVTTTPQSIPIIRRLIADPTTRITRGSSYDNRDNLAADFFSKLRRYEGTALGRQEIYGEVVDLSENAILPRSWWRVWTDLRLPKIEVVLLSFDTAAKDKIQNDFSAMTAWGLFRPLDAEDEDEWAAILIRAWRKKLRLPALIEAAKAEIEDEDGRYGAPPDHVVIEDTSAGIGLIQMLEEAGVSAHPYSPDKDKVMRASLASVYLKSGRIYVLGRKNGMGGRSATDLNPDSEMVVAECEAFPPAKKKTVVRHIPDGADDATDGHDDLVDTCTQAWTYLADLGYLIADTALPEVDPEFYDEPRAPVYG